MGQVNQILLTASWRAIQPIEFLLLLRGFYDEDHCNFVEENIT